MDSVYLNQTYRASTKGFCNSMHLNNPLFLYYTSNFLQNPINLEHEYLLHFSRQPHAYTHTHTKEKEKKKNNSKAKEEASHTWPTWQALLEQRVPSNDVDEIAEIKIGHRGSFVRTSALETR